MEKQYICYQGKDGKPDYREATPAEISAMQQPQLTWHKELKNARACFPNEQYNANLQKLLAHNLGLENHQFLAALVADVAAGAFIRVDDIGIVYYYCNYVEELDEAIVINYGGYVETKPQTNDKI